MNTVYLGLGSNMGDKEGNIKEALERLENIGTVSDVAPFIITAPVGYEAQPDFINTACKLTTSFTPKQVLQEIEIMMIDMGRVRDIKNGPRPIDIDILLWNDDIINDDDLIVPHPRMLERVFVLQPLSKIAPDVVHPISGKTIKEHYRKITT